MISFIIKKRNNNNAFVRNKQVITIFTKGSQIIALFACHIVDKMNENVLHICYICDEEEQTSDIITSKK